MPDVETTAPKQQNSFKQNAKSVAQLAALGAWGSSEPDSSAGGGNTFHTPPAKSQAPTSHDHAGVQSSRQSNRSPLKKASASKSVAPIAVLGAWGVPEPETEVMKSRGSSRGSENNLSCPGTDDRPGSSGRGWSRAGLQVCWNLLAPTPLRALNNQYDLLIISRVWWQGKTHERLIATAGDGLLGITFSFRSHCFPR